MSSFRIIAWGAIFLGAIFIILAYSILSFSSIQAGRVKLNSPDETANYFFARTLAQTNAIGYAEPLLLQSKGVVHPRSMTTAGDKVVPVGFLGLAVIYGMLGKAFGAQTMLFFTPILAVLSAGIFYFFIRNIFSRRVAALSAALLLIHPAYWYYASRGMLPNILFVDILLLGALFLVMAEQKKQTMLYLLGGLFAGFALTVRLSEIIWVVGALFITGAVMLGKRFFIAAILTAFGIAIPIAGLFFLNAQVYGHPLIFGYQSAATYESVASFDRVLALVRDFSVAQFPEIKNEFGVMLAKLRGYAFPFGFAPLTFQKNFQEYGIAMFWWFTLPTVFGFLIVLKKGLYDLFAARKKTLIVYTAISLLVGYWLVAFYGSWVFYDNISEEVTIGNSYVRYWLPLYVLSLPFVASLFVWLTAGQSRGRASRVLLATSTIVVMLFFSGKAALYEYRDSIFPIAENIKSYHRSAAWITTVTEQDAVIFSERSDKNFFPERRVAQSFPNLAERALVPPLAERVPVYYYSMWTPKDADYVSQRYFSDHGLRLELVEPFQNGERLYKVVRVQEL